LGQIGSNLVKNARICVASMQAMQRYTISNTANNTARKSLIPSVLASYVHQVKHKQF